MTSLLRLDFRPHLTSTPIYPPPVTINLSSLSPAAGFPSGNAGEPGCIPWSPERPASGSPQRGNGCTLPRCWYRRRSTRWTLSVEEGEGERVKGHQSKTRTVPVQVLDSNSARDICPFAFFLLLLFPPKCIITLTY